MERFMGDDMLVEHGKDTPQMLVKYEDCVQEIALTKADAQATIATLQARAEQAERLVALQAQEILQRRQTLGDLAHLHQQQSKELTQRTAELARVRLLSSHNERRFEMLEEKYKELRTLIAALPKVEGEIT